MTTTAWIVLLSGLFLVLFLAKAVAGACVVVKECGWCGKALKLGSELDLANQGGVSHGICEECRRMNFPDIKFMEEVVNPEGF